MPASQERLPAECNGLAAKSNARGSYFCYRVMTVYMHLSTDGTNCFITYCISEHIRYCGTILYLLARETRSFLRDMFALMNPGVVAESLPLF